MLFVCVYVCVLFSQKENRKRRRKKKEWKYSIKGGQRKRGKIKGGK